MIEMTCSKLKYTEFFRIRFHVKNHRKMSSQTIFHFHIQVFIDLWRNKKLRLSPLFIFLFHAIFMFAKKPLISSVPIKPTVMDIRWGLVFPLSYVEVFILVLRMNKNSFSRFSLMHPPPKYEGNNKEDLFLVFQLENLYRAKGPAFVGFKFFSVRKEGRNVHSDIGIERGLQWIKNAPVCGSWACHICSLCCHVYAVACRGIAMHFCMRMQKSALLPRASLACKKYVHKRRFFE